MADLSTRYMGLQLRNPLIVGSSGLTDSVEKVIELEQAGAGAVVLKSLFEEQILHDYQERLSELEMQTAYPEAEEYIINHTRQNALEEYLELIRHSRQRISIPVIASINCISSSEWVNFALDIQEAGADALELNIFQLPSDPSRNSEQNEETYLNIMREVVRRVNIPVAVKISPYFSALANTTMKFSWTGIAGLVLFNRYYASDIDLDTFTITSGNVFSSPYEYYLPLRWTAILSDRVNCDIAATTGIHSGDSALKLILAGARAIQVCSVIYQQGSSQIGRILREMDLMLQRKGIETLASVIGKMSMRAVDNPASYERVQFMRYFSQVE
jgi:dihydroorotate dehydrogenase (fumarate)